MVIDGRAIAHDMYKDLAERRAKFSQALRLGIIVCGANPVIESFVRIKTRAAATLNIEMVREDLPETTSTAEAIEAVQNLAARTDAIIVQLPLPKTIDTEATLAAIPAEKDVDAINPHILDDERPVFAPVALAVAEILRRTNVAIEGKRVVVVGAGRLVGAPSAHLLKRLGARVSIFSLQEGSIDDLKDADIAVLGAGKPGFIKAEHIKAGAAIIDAGTSEQGGKVVGDADLGCREKASVITPVPGGVGPVAVAMIFRNFFDLLDRN